MSNLNAKQYDVSQLAITQFRKQLLYGWYKHCELCFVKHTDSMSNIKLRHSTSKPFRILYEQAKYKNKHKH